MKQLLEMLNFIKVNEEFERVLNGFVKDARHNFREGEKALEVVLCILILTTTRSLTIPNNPDNLDDLIKPENLIKSLSDRDLMKESIKTLDDGFNEKHKIVYDLVKEIDDGSTLTTKEYDSIILKKDLDVNKIINEYVEKLNDMFIAGSDSPLNTVAGLSLFSIHAIRKCLYSHGVEDNPHLKTLSKMLDL